MEWPEHWLKVIDATKLWADGDRMCVLSDFYACVPWQLTAAKLTVSRGKYYDLLDEVHHYAALCAVQLGLIKIF